MYRKLSVVLVAMTMLAGTAVQAESPMKDAPAAAEGSDREAPRPDNGVRRLEPRNLSPMHKEIFDAFESERAKVEDLNLRFGHAVSLAEKLAIQREIEAVKKAGQIAVLEIQLRHARSAGRTEAVRQLEGALEAVRNPKLGEPSGTRLIERMAGAPRDGAVVNRR